MLWAMGHISHQKQKIRDTIEWIRWELLENQDKMKTHIFDIQEYAKLKFCRLKRRWTVTSDNHRTGDGRFSTILEKIKTWPRLGSRKVRDHTATSQGAQQGGERSSKGGRIKARSFPAKHGDSSRVSFLPNRTKVESICEESHGGSVETTHQVVASATTHPDEPEFLNVFGDVEVDVDPAVGGNLESINIDSCPSIPSFGEESSGIGRDSMEFPSSASNRSIPEDNQPDYSVSDPVSDVSQGTFSQTYPDNSGWQEGSPAVHDKSVSSQVYERPKSNYKGVRYKHNKWTTEIRPPNGKKTVWLGTYKTEEEAASAHDAGIYYFEKSPLDFNFPESLEYLMANPLNTSLDEKPKLNFIKTQARLIASNRVKRKMGKQLEAEATTWIPGHVNPDSSDMSYESSLPDPKRLRQKRAKSLDFPGSQKNCRTKIG